MIFAAVNQGQARKLPSRLREMKAKLYGWRRHHPGRLWLTPVASTDDYVAINPGQLKNIAKPFYDQLIADGYTDRYPWTGGASPADDYALANIARSKIFSASTSRIQGRHRPRRLPENGRCNTSGRSPPGPTDDPGTVGGRSCRVTSRN